MAEVTAALVKELREKSGAGMMDCKRALSENDANIEAAVDWLRKNPQVSFILVNPKNPYHWMSIKATAIREISEDDPVEGPRVTQQLDYIWTKYTGQEGPYGLRDPGFDERRVLFELKVDSLATFGQP